VGFMTTTAKITTVSGAAWRLPLKMLQLCNATFNTCGIKKNIGCLLQDAAVLNDASKIAIAPDAFIKSGFVVGSA
ncbi:hypothetical protein OFD18_34720, partial [Escherichia coli]|nr:hypothetical protein [Escherichia coli]